MRCWLVCLTDSVVLAAHGCWLSQGADAMAVGQVDGSPQHALAAERFLGLLPWPALGHRSTS
jgi:hypothetical protein